MPLIINYKLIISNYYKSSLNYYFNSIMEKDSNLFANIEERKEPLLSIPTLNLDNMNEDEPLRRDTEPVTFRGDSVHAV